MKKGISVSPLIIVYVVIGMTLGFFLGGEVIHRLYSSKLTELLADGGAERVDSGPYWKPGEPAAGDRRVNAIIWATRKTAPSVVGIEVTQIRVVRETNRGSYYFNHFLKGGDAPRQYRKVEDVGSGFVISTDGMILTNFHVVQNATKLYVNFPDGRRIEGKVVGVDERSDIALVSVPGNNFKPVTFGNSDRCLTGEWSIALGNPFLSFINDAHPTVTVGVISALNRNFAPSEGMYYRGMIQTDAAINPGNSGGPLVNTHGEVIGVNSFIYTGGAESAGSIGIGFAIPINRARRVAEELIAHGYRRQVWTGITVQKAARPIGARLIPGDGVDGVEVSGVRPQSPGEAAGLRQGDIIYRMDNIPIQSGADLDGFFLDYYVNDTIDVYFTRGGKRTQTKIILKELPNRRR